MAEAAGLYVANNVGAAVIGLLVTPVFNKLADYAGTAWYCKRECAALANTLQKKYVQRFARELDQLSQIESSWDFWDEAQDLGDLLDEAEYVVLACQRTASSDVRKLVKLGTRIKTVSDRLDKFTGRHAASVTTHLVACKAARHEQLAARGRAEVRAMQTSYAHEDLLGPPQPGHTDPDVVVKIAKVVFQHLDDVVPEICTRLHATGAAGARHIGVVGMPGLGKTTIASKVYETKKGEYDRHFFLTVSEKPDVLTLQSSVFRALHPGTTVPFDTTAGGLEALTRELGGTKTLLVLDDVWSQDDLKHLNFATALNMRHADSRLIVTTRDQAVLDQLDGVFIKQPDLLSDPNALKLLCHHAFPGAQEPDVPNSSTDQEFTEIVQQRFPDYASEIVAMLGECKGLPLALQVLGSRLCGEPATVWQSVIDDLKKIDPKLDATTKIRKRCLPSFKALPPHLQQCFMDFAAYPEDEHVRETELTSLWAATAVVAADAEWGKKQLAELERRCLVLRDYRGVYMHDILRDLAVGAADYSEAHRFREKPGKTASGPRAWRFVARCACMSDLGDAGDGGAGRVRMASWHSAGLTCLPTLPPRLRMLFLQGNQIADMPALAQTSLRVLSLSGNSALETLRLDKLLLLRVLDLRGCTGLDELPVEVTGLAALQSLNLGGCRGLTALPDGIGGLTALQRLDLTDCSALTELPDGIRGLTALQNLDLRLCSRLKALPDGIGGLTALQSLNLRMCFRMTALPDVIGGLAALQHLNLKGCFGLTALPDGIGGLAALQQLNLEGCSRLTALPDGIRGLTALQHLDLG